jgi:hypothetical protein
MRIMTKAFLALVLAFLVAACGALSGQSNHPLPSPPYGALTKWKDFPADANPRPVIAFGDTVEDIPEAGFPDGERKLAWMCNRFVLGKGVSLTADAAAAFARLMSERAARSDSSPQCTTLASFVIAGARLASAGFPTDRGIRQMPAWLFDIPEVNAYIGHLALDPSALWGGKVMAEQGRGARVSADGMTLRVPADNQQPGPCGSDYTAVAAESGAAVAVAVRQFPHAAPDQPVACDAMLRIGYVDVPLKSPLDGRVLLDEQGRVGTVCAESGEC